MTEKTERAAWQAKTQGYGTQEWGAPYILDAVIGLPSRNKFQTAPDSCILASYEESLYWWSDASGRGAGNYLDGRNPWRHPVKFEERNLRTKTSNYQSVYKDGVFSWDAEDEPSAGVSYRDE